MRFEDTYLFDHAEALAKRNVIQTHVASRLSIGLLHLLMNGFLRPVYLRHIQSRNCILK